MPAYSSYHIKVLGGISKIRELICFYWYMFSREINYNKNQANWKAWQVERNFWIIKYLEKILVCVFTFPTHFSSLKRMLWRILSHFFKSILKSLCHAYYFTPFISEETGVLRQHTLNQATNMQEWRNALTNQRWWLTAVVPKPQITGWSLAVAEMHRSQQLLWVTTP